jgi:hypothetical protein
MLNKSSCHSPPNGTLSPAPISSPPPPAPPLTPPWQEALEQEVVRAKAALVKAAQEREQAVKRAVEDSERMVRAIEAEKERERKEQQQRLQVGSAPWGVGRKGYGPRQHRHVVRPLAAWLVTFDPPPLSSCKCPAPPATAPPPLHRTLNSHTACLCTRKWR